ncbi:MAG: carbohydrate ABC transporter permease [Oscillospiraceae bacterium]|nr:carbohydrate ABC transporter permease [Oscillospiraceae bacterium]
MVKKVNVFTIIKYALLIIFLFLIIYPIYMVAVGSFRKNTQILMDPFGLPTEFSIANFSKAWISGKLYSMYINSFIVTLGSVAVIILFSSLIGYVMSRRDFKFKKLLFIAIIVGMTIPSQVGIIPLYLQMVKMRLADTLVGLMIVYTVNFLSYSTFVMYGFIKTIPKEIQEAAIVDGCSNYRMYYSIIMPLSTAVIMTVTIFNLMFIWNDMFFSMIMVSTPAKKTLMIGLLSFVGQYYSDYATMFAGVILVSLPMLALFLLLQRQFLEGATKGAIKG